MRRFLPENPWRCSRHAERQSRRSLVPSDQPFDVIWRGVTPQEILDASAHCDERGRTKPILSCSIPVIGYRGGNFGSSSGRKEAMQWQQKAGQEADPLLSGRHWLHARTCIGTTAYPHIKGDELAEQAQALANRAYEEAAQRLPGSLRELGVHHPRRLADNRLLHMPKGEGRFRRC